MTIIFIKTKDGFEENYTVKDMAYSNEYLTVMTAEKDLLGFDLKEIESFETITQE